MRDWAPPALLSTTASLRYAIAKRRVHTRSFFQKRHGPHHIARRCSKPASTSRSASERARVTCSNRVLARMVRSDSPIRSRRRVRQAVHRSDDRAIVLGVLATETSAAPSPPDQLGRQRRSRRPSGSIWPCTTAFAPSRWRARGQGQIERRLPAPAHSSERLADGSASSSRITPDCAVDPQRLGEGRSKRRRPSGSRKSASTTGPAPRAHRSRPASPPARCRAGRIAM